MKRRSLASFACLVFLLAALLVPMPSHAQREAVAGEPDAYSERSAGWAARGFWSWLSSLFSPEHGQIVP